MTAASHATGDFETRSVCDIDFGPYIYSHHATTQVLCLAYKLPGASTKLWHRGHPRVGIEQSAPPEDLIQFILQGGMFEAHNSAFEYHVWNETLRREFPFFPELPQEQMLCSAAKAAQYALPRSLGQSCQVLGLAKQKDEDGKKVMLRVSKLPGKHDGLVKLVQSGLMDPSDLPWNEDPTDLKVTWVYCMDDVEAEHGLSEYCGSMSAKQLELWRMDQRMNARGIMCDVEGAQMAVDLAEAATDQLNSRLREVTDGAVPKGSSRVKFKKWLNDMGAPAINTQADYLEELLQKIDGQVKERVEEAIRISIDVNKTSTSKYKTMTEAAYIDGRLRDLMMYYGAARTGRWAGKIVQPHNFVRGFSKEMELVWRHIRMAHEREDIEILEVLYGSAMACLAKAARGALVASPGKELYVADYAAIEARTLPWLALDNPTLDIFRTGADIYLKMAGDIYRDEPDQAEFMEWINKLELSPTDKELLGVIKKMFPVQRQMGKKAILGLGYQMGDERFDDECAAEGIDLPRAFCTKVVKTYRNDSFPLISSYWPETEEAAVNAVANPDVRFDARMVAYKKSGRFLHCRLPSGKILRYMDPAVVERHTYVWEAVSKLGKAATVRVTVKPEEPLPAVWKRAQHNAKLSEKSIPDPRAYERSERPQLSFMGIDQKTKQWVRHTTYGGSLVENNNQATAADFMGEGMLRCDKHPVYDLLLSVHDELIAEAPIGQGDVKEFEELMSALPEWVDPEYECPIAAEGWKGQRYRK